MKFLNSIRGKVFVYFAGLVLLLISSFSFLYYRSISSALTAQAFQTLLSLAVSSSNSLDASVDNLDSTVRRIVSSSLIKKEFYKQPQSQQEHFDNSRAITQLLFEISASDTKNAVNLMGESGKLVQHGKRFDMSSLSEQQLETLEPTLRRICSLEGSIYISSEPLLPEVHCEDFCFSICRSFNKTFSTKHNAVVEIQVDYKRMDAFIQSVLGAEGSANRRVLVYDSYGNLLYPSSLSDADQIFRAIPSEDTSGTFVLDTAKSSEVSAFSRSTYTGITLLVCEDADSLYAPVKSFRNRLLMISFVILLLTELVVSVLSRQLTKPIHALQVSINSLELDRLDSDAAPLYKPSTWELANLSTAYENMVTRLRLSLNETVTARSHEIKSRMLALQAQMNPHFLYNCIAVISARADEYEADDVVEMCETLSSMLRYVTKETPGHVTLRDEMRHLEQYLFLMKCRYPEHFAFSISIPPEMESLIVPKLILQPLVENSFKHGFQTNDLWTMNIQGRTAGSHWEITLTDNGVGFSQEALRILQQGFGNSQPAQESSGMEHIGLLNIYHRLKFLYKDQAIFRIANLPQGGCCITLGGTCSFDRLPTLPGCKEE